MVELKAKRGRRKPLLVLSISKAEFALITVGLSPTLIWAFTTHVIPNSIAKLRIFLANVFFVIVF